MLLGPNSDGVETTSKETIAPREHSVRKRSFAYVISFGGQEGATKPNVDAEQVDQLRSPHPVRVGEPKIAWEGGF